MSCWPRARSLREARVVELFCGWCPPFRGPSTRRPQRGQLRLFVYDAQPSTGISDALLGWVDHPMAMAQAHHPDATAVFLGGNDGFPLRTVHAQVACCGHGWVDAYAERVREMMGVRRLRNDAILAS